MVEDWCADSGSANSGSTTKPGRGIRMYMLSALVCCESALFECVEWYVPLYATSGVRRGIRGRRA